MFTVQLKLESPKAEDDDSWQSPWRMVEMSKGCVNGLNAFVERVLLMGRFWVSRW